MDQDLMLQQLLMLGKRRLQQMGDTSQQPLGYGGQPAYPPLGQTLQPQPPPMLTPAPATGMGATTTAVDEDGNPLQTYARGERPFGNSREAVTGGGYTPPGSNTPPADTGTSEAGGRAPAAQSGNKLIDALRGVTAPKPPEVQRVGTPNLPPLRPIDQGELIKMLASLGIGPQQAMSMKLGR